MMKKLVCSFCVLLAVVCFASFSSAEAAWWDKFGKPQYSGTLVLRQDRLGAIPPDPWDLRTAIGWLCFDSLFVPDWTVSPDTYTISGIFNDPQYMKGLLAESWELSDPKTMTVYLRKGIHYQDKPPVNGREFNAYDVKYNYDRFIGLGDFTKGSPMYSGAYPSIKEIVVIDDYTVAFKFKGSNATAVLEVLNGGSFAGWQALAPPELSKQGLTREWETAATGTGPFLFKDFIDGVSLTYIKNPNYWGYDERYPQNKLPYLDEFKLLEIGDMATAMAAMRTGRIDMMAHGRSYPSWVDVENILKTNPDVQTAFLPVAGLSLEFRCDKPPFTDIRVRKALQMAIDRKAIAKTYYNGTVSGEPCGMIHPADKGWCVPFIEWPEALKAEYSYNVTKAKELLAEAGHPAGFKTNCVISTSHDLQLLQIIKDQFMDIGVDMEISVMDHPTFINYTKSFKHDQMRSQAGAGGPFGPFNSLATRLSENPNNVTKNNDSIYDAMFAEITEVSDLDVVKKLTREADLYTLTHHWSVNLFPLKANVLWQDYVKGYSGQYLPGGCPFFSRIWKK